jgi:endonuclease IV
VWRIALPQFGLKLGVGETVLARRAEILWRKKQIDFFELYIPRDVESGSAEFWRWYNGVLVFHAPHAFGGFNFAQSGMVAENAAILVGIEALREKMNPGMVIFHPGLNGNIKELFRQVAGVRQEYPDLHSIMLMENKPRIGLNGEKCLGSSPAEMRNILSETGCGFCCDVRHAFAYAAWAGREWHEVLAEFAELEPRLWHVADGDMDSHVDSHKHIGDGSMPWEKIGGFWTGDAMVTIECAKVQNEMLKDFLQDVALLRRRTEQA